MELKEEKIKELKEIRRGFAILFLAVLTIEGNILLKYIENKDILLEKIMIFGLFALILLSVAIFILSLPIWRLLKNGK